VLFALVVLTFTNGDDFLLFDFFVVCYDYKYPFFAP